MGGVFCGQVYQERAQPPEILLGCASHCFEVRLRASPYAQNDTGGEGEPAGRCEAAESPNGRARRPAPTRGRGGVLSPQSPSVPAPLGHKGSLCEGFRAGAFSLSLATLDSGRNHRLLPALAKNMPPAYFLNASRPI